MRVVGKVVDLIDNGVDNLSPFIDRPRNPLLGAQA